MSREVPPPVRLADGAELTFDRVRVMGVLNVTPDSFSDGGRYLATADAVARGLALAAAGADLIDVGGESTRPGSDPVPAAVQIARVRPVIERLAAAASTPVSIDTTSARVAEAALDAGASLVNDISAFRFDPDMLPLLAERGTAAVAMHTLASPRAMQEAPRYDDVVEDVRRHLEGRLEACRMAGVAIEQILVDPGIGFGKTVAHNLQLLGGLPRLASLGRPLVVGTSRKSFLGVLTGRPVEARLMATAASSAAAVVLGAHVLRVHDVMELRDAVSVADAIAYGRPRAIG